MWIRNIAMIGLTPEVLLISVPVIAMAKGKVPSFLAPSVYTVLHAKIAWGKLFKFGTAMSWIQGWLWRLLFTQRPKASMWTDFPSYLNYKFLVWVLQQNMLSGWIIFSLGLLFFLHIACWLHENFAWRDIEQNAWCMVEPFRSTQGRKLSYTCHIITLH